MHRTTGHMNTRAREIERNTEIMKRVGLLVVDREDEMTQERWLLRQTVTEKREELSVLLLQSRRNLRFTSSRNDINCDHVIKFVFNITWCRFGGAWSVCTFSIINSFIFSVLCPDSIGCTNNMLRSFPECRATEWQAYQHFSVSLKRRYADRRSSWRHMRDRGIDTKHRSREWVKSCMRDCDL